MPKETLDKLQEEVLKQPKQELAKETKEESVETSTEMNLEAENNEKLNSQLSPREALIQKIAANYKVENGTENMVHVLIMPKITFDPVTGKPKENGVVQIMGKNEFMIFKRATLPGKEIYVIHEP
jgi:hypothetical protein